MESDDYKNLHNCYNEEEVHKQLELSSMVLLKNARNAKTGTSVDINNKISIWFVVNSYFPLNIKIFSELIQAQNTLLRRVEVLL